VWAAILYQLFRLCRLNRLSKVFGVQSGWLPEMTLSRFT
jgi:hypothetical protein